MDKENIFENDENNSSSDKKSNSNSNCIIKNNNSKNEKEDTSVFENIFERLSLWYKMSIERNIYIYEFHTTDYKNDFLGCIKFCEKS